MTTIKDDANQNPAIQSSVEGAPSALHDIGSPTVGAIKAAKMVAGTIIAGYENRTPVSTKDIAVIIDRESGLLELLEACKSILEWYDMDAERADITYARFDNLRAVIAKFEPSPSDSAAQEKG